MHAKKSFRGLGVVSSVNEERYLFYAFTVGKETILRADKSDNGFDFQPSVLTPQIINETGEPLNAASCKDLRMAFLGKSYFLTCVQEEKGKPILKIAYSKALGQWHVLQSDPNLNDASVIVSDFLYQDNQFILYSGGRSLRVAYSEDLMDWKINKEPIISLPESETDAKIKVANEYLINDGLLLFYYEYNLKNNGWVISALLLDLKDPSKIIWQPKTPLWESPKNWAEKKVNPLGILKIGEHLISYWEFEGEKIFALQHPHHFFQSLDDWYTRNKALALKKSKTNPLLGPILDNSWESKAAFNPAAVYENGKVYIIYRAVGDSDVSVLGCATSKDGFNIDVRFPEPIYLPREPFEGGFTGLKTSYFSPFMSGGGGSGGCEDPRITKIDKRFYLTYVAYDGWSHPRIALSSISEEDFINHRWGMWARPVLISKPRVIDKSAVLLPEKVRGKYVIFHRVFPDILIDFVDNLKFDDGAYLKGEYSISPRPNFWDSRKIGIGPTPIKTKDGWLVIYNGVDNKDDSKYKIGAMMLDLNDPTKILYRCKEPVLQPDKHYENHGLKYGVVYPCGATVLKGKLIVYYGGSDMYVCAAQANLNKFLKQLKFHGSPKLEPATILS